MRKLLAIAPWLVAWTGEAEAAFRPCPHAGGKLATWCATAPGNGKPLFKSLHPVRLRQCIAERLCGVCGEPTTNADRWMLNRGYWATGRNGDLRFVLRDFLLHGQCAEYALANCPWLREQRPMRVRAPEEFGTIATASHADLKGENGKPGYSGPVIERLWLTLAPADTVRQFGRLIEKPPGLNRHDRRLLRKG